MYSSAAIHARGKSVIDDQISRLRNPLVGIQAARELLDRAIRRRESASFPGFVREKPQGGLVRVYGRRALALVRLREGVAALEDCEQALQLCEAAKEPQWQRVRLLVEGWIRLTEGDHARAAGLAHSVVAQASVDAEAQWLAARRLCRTAEAVSQQAKPTFVHVNLAPKTGSDPQRPRPKAPVSLAPRRRSIARHVRVSSRVDVFAPLSFGHTDGADSKRALLGTTSDLADFVGSDGTGSLTAKRICAGCTRRASLLSASPATNINQCRTHTILRAFMADLTRLHA